MGDSVKGAEEFAYQIVVIVIMAVTMAGCLKGIYTIALETWQSWRHGPEPSETAQTFMQACARLQSLPTDKLLEERRFLSLRLEKAAEAREERMVERYLEMLDRVEKTLSGEVTREQYNSATADKLRREIKADVVEEVTKKLQQHLQTREMA